MKWNKCNKCFSLEEKCSATLIVPDMVSKGLLNGDGFLVERVEG